LFFATVSFEKIDILVYICVSFAGASFVFTLITWYMLTRKTSWSMMLVFVPYFCLFWIDPVFLVLPVSGLLGLRFSFSYSKNTENKIRIWSTLSSFVFYTILAIELNRMSKNSTNDSEHASIILWSTSIFMILGIFLSLYSSAVYFYKNST